MLTRLDLLHYCPFADAACRLAGGDPVFVRDGAAYARGEGLKPRSLIRATPRFEKYQMPNGDWRSMMLLERAGSNIITYPTSLETTWVKSNVTTTLSQEDPFGGSSGTLCAVPINGGAVRFDGLAFTTSATKSFSIAVKRPLHYSTSTYFQFGIYDASAAVWRHIVQAPWGTRRPEPFTEVGAGDIWKPIDLGRAWWEMRAKANGVVHTNTNIFYFYPAGQVTGHCLFGYAQAEDAAFPTSMVPGPDGSTNLRALEKVYWKNAAPPQNSLYYGRYIHRGDEATGIQWRMVLGSGAYSPPFWGIFQGTSTHHLTIYYNNNAGGGAFSLTVEPAVTPKPGDLIEFVAIMQEDGSCRIIMAVNEYNISVNGGGAGTFPAFPTSWGDNNLWLNGWDTTEVGATLWDGLMGVRTANMRHHPITASREAVVDEVRKFYMTLPKAA